MCRRLVERRDRDQLAAERASATRTARHNAQRRLCGGVDFFLRVGCHAAGILAPAGSDWKRQ